MKPKSERGFSDQCAWPWGFAPPGMKVGKRQHALTGVQLAGKGARDSASDSDRVSGQTPVFNVPPEPVFKIHQFDMKEK
jgi:hypothetical protein